MRNLSLYCISVICLVALTFSDLTLATSQVNLNKSLTGQNAIVWGASQGIGREIAKDLARKGAFTYLVARNKDKLEKVRAEIELAGGRAQVYTGDITKNAQIINVTSEILNDAKRIDILVQNVGIYPRSTIEDMSEEFFRSIIETNLISTFNTVKAIFPHMKNNNYGKIVLVSSITGPQTGIPGLSAYGASKSALSGFVKGAAIEFAPYKVNINIVEPGYIKTPGIDYLGPEYFEKVDKSIPLGRMGDSSEIAKVVSFLASNDSSYVTGTSIVIDGGLTLPESHYLHVVAKDKKKAK